MAEFSRLSWTDTERVNFTPPIESVPETFSINEISRLYLAAPAKGTTQVDVIMQFELVHHGHGLLLDHEDLAGPVPVGM